MTSVTAREETASTVARNAGMYWSSQLKALAVGRNRPSSQRRLYAGLVGLLTLSTIKIMSHHTTDLVLHENLFFFNM